MLDDVAWRVDVTVSSSAAAKVLRPTVLMTTKTREPTPTTKTFELSLEAFQELRVSVARMLTEMEWAEKALEEEEDRKREESEAEEDE